MKNTKTRSHGVLLTDEEQPRSLGVRTALRLRQINSNVEINLICTSAAVA